MNRKMSILFKAMIIFAILFYCIYFTSYTCSEAGLATHGLIELHYERGLRLYKTGEYEKAIMELESVLYLDANHKKAKKYLQAAKKRYNKKVVNQLYREANDYYKQREFDEALGTYQKILSIIPDDGYSLYKIELLKSRIEKEIKLREKEEYRKRVEELERLSQEGLEKEKMQKKLDILELERQEKERRKREFERKQLSKLRIKARESDMVKDLDKVQNLLTKDEKIVSPSISVFSQEKFEGEDVFIDKSSEKERIKKVKSLYKLGKEHYRDREYRKAISIFQEVIDLEIHFRKVYTPYAERYIKKAKKKIRAEIGSAKVKEVEEIESEMINKIIESAKIYVD
ncbi:MAG: tetratricopeptide repeat protein [Candidatus Omnitrophota bacterium]